MGIDKRIGEKIKKALRKIFLSDSEEIKKRAIEKEANAQKLRKEKYQNTRTAIEEIKNVLKKRLEQKEFFTKKELKEFKERLRKALEDCPKKNKILEREINILTGRMDELKKIQKISRGLHRLKRKIKQASRNKDFHRLKGYRQKLISGSEETNEMNKIPDELSVLFDQRKKWIEQECLALLHQIDRIKPKKVQICSKNFQKEEIEFKEKNQEEIKKEEIKEIPKKQIELPKVEKPEPSEKFPNPTTPFEFLEFLRKYNTNKKKPRSAVALAQWIGLEKSNWPNTESIGFKYEKHRREFPCYTNIEQYKEISKLVIKKADTVFYFYEPITFHKSNKDKIVFPQRWLFYFTLLNTLTVLGKQGENSENPKYYIVTCYRPVEKANHIKKQIRHSRNYH